MNKKKKIGKMVLMILTIVMIVRLASADCLQETANKSSAGDGTCGLQYSGLYYADAPWNAFYQERGLYDGVWTTNSASYNTRSYYYVNYTKPTGYINISYWMIKVGTHAGILAPENLTLNNSCIANSSSIIQLRVYSRFNTECNAGVQKCGGLFECYNGTGWMTMKNHSYMHLLYEDKMVWNDTAHYSFTGGITPSCTVIHGSLSASLVYSAGNSATDTISCTYSGYYPLEETYNINEGNKEFTMISDSIRLWFRSYNESLQPAKGYWTDGNKTESFNATNVSVSITNSSEGLIKIYFGYNATSMNYTQFYEFNNDATSITTENITVLINQSINSVYIKIIDQSGNPVNDVLNRLTISKPSTGGIYKLIGQRYSGGIGTEGVTVFNIPTDADISLISSKDGYTPKTTLRNIDTTEYTASNPLVITLTRGSAVGYKGAYFGFSQRWYDNTTSHIYLDVYSPFSETLTITTSEISSNYSYTFNEFGLANVDMTSGTFFSASCVKDLNVTAWLDGVYYNAFTIDCEGFDTSKMNAPSLSLNWMYKLGWIGLLLVVGIVGLIFKKDGEGEGTGAMGKGIFFIGCGIIPIILYGYFNFLTAIAVFYAVGVVLRKYVSE